VWYLSRFYQTYLNIISGYLFNYSYITSVDKVEAEYIESRGLGGEELYPEDGDTAWDNENTIYLEVPYKEFKLIDLNERWNESQYFLDNEKLSSFIAELNNKVF
jgi:hypothetical protein